MTKKRRTILFFTLLFLFIFVTPITVFYAQGYRFDFDNKKITQTGGIFLKVLPKQTAIYIDGELSKKTDFFFGSAFIENLIPKLYEIRVEKEGYQVWKKNLEVKEKEVVEVKNIILFPKNNEFISLSKNVEEFWISPNQKMIITKEKENSLWVLKLFETDKNIKSHLVRQDHVLLNGAEFLSLKFLESPEEIIIEVELKEQIKYFSINLKEAPLKLKQKITPEDNHIASYLFYYLDEDGFIYKNDGQKENKEKIIKEPFPLKEETHYELFVFDRNIFLQEEKTLYRYNYETENFDIFFENIKDLTLSPDQKKIAYFSNKELWLFFTEETSLNETGNKVMLFRLSDDIGNVFWVNSHYMLFSAGDSIKITEIDIRDRINIIELSKTKSSQLFWSEINNKLYILSDNNLRFLSLLF